MSPVWVHHESCSIMCYNVLSSAISMSTPILLMDHCIPDIMYRHHPPWSLAKSMSADTYHLKKAPT